MIAQKKLHCSLFPLLVVTICRWPKTTFKPGEINHCFYIFQISADSHTLVTPAELHQCRNTAALMVAALWDVYEYCKQPPVWRGALTESIRCEWYQMHGPHLLWVWGSAQILHILPHQVAWRRELRFLPVHEERRLNVGRWNSLH